MRDSTNINLLDNNAEQPSVIRVNEPDKGESDGQQDKDDGQQDKSEDKDEQNAEEQDAEEQDEEEQDEEGTKTI